MKGTKLTERQRLFATEHHNVLEEFLLKRGLDYDDYYDVVVFKFLKAVKQYDEVERLRKQAFKDVAVSLMQMAVDNHRRALKQQRENVFVLSLDYMPKNRDGLLFSERIADETTDIWDIICDRLDASPNQHTLSHTYPEECAFASVLLREVM